MTENVREKAAKGVFWALLQNGGQRALGLLVFLVLAHLLQPKAFGLVALANAFTVLAELIVSMGFVAAIVQRSDLTAAHLNTAFWANLVFGVLLALLLCFTATWIADAFGAPQLAPVLRWLSLVLPLQAAAKVQEGLMQRKFQFSTLAVRTLLGAVVGGLVGALMALNGYGVWSLVAQQLTGSFAALVTLWANSAWRPNFAFSRQAFRQLAGFGVYQMGSNVLQFLDQQADRLLVGYFFGPVVLGYYFVGRRLIIVLQQAVYQSLTSVVLPVFSALRDDPARQRQAFLTGNRLLALVAFPVFGLIAAAGPQVVAILFGQKWHLSVPIMQLLAVAALLESTIAFVAPMFLALGKSSWSFRLSTARLIFGVSLYALAIPFGIVAVAAAWPVRALILLPVYFWVVRRPLHLNFRRLLQPYLVPGAGLLATVLAALGVRVVASQVGAGIPLTLGITISLSLALYAAVVWYLEPGLLRGAMSFVRVGRPSGRAAG